MQYSKGHLKAYSEWSCRHSEGQNGQLDWPESDIGVLLMCRLRMLQLQIAAGFVDVQRGQAGIAAKPAGCLLCPGHHAASRSTWKDDWVEQDRRDTLGVMECQALFCYEMEARCMCSMGAAAV
jgi:ribosome modulation factor